ncbi:hypothetical protein KY290_036362 [Solanum tuberosum]|uniref:Uncharacterized protein n=1 Tax=Solanum tuberosum TaxID=4113 RepID=A0ABQ7TU24_SOLTU|nr:hypothetical protein KY290_036362 [Solanum tuberosum]
MRIEWNDSNFGGRDSRDFFAGCGLSTSPEPNPGQNSGNTRMFKSKSGWLIVDPTPSLRRNSDTSANATVSVIAVVVTPFVSSQSLSSRKTLVANQTLVSPSTAVIVTGASSFGSVSSS